MTSTGPLPARPRVSLLIPNRDNAPTLGLVLERLVEHTTYPDVELVVVDDGSTDGSLEILRDWRDSGRFPGDFRLIEQEPSGVVEALNRGLNEATGEVVVQLDADATVETTGWIETMLGLLQADPRVGVVTPKILKDARIGRRPGWVVNAYGVAAICPEGLHDRGALVVEPVGRRTSHQRVRRLVERPGDLGESVAEVDCGIGCCMMYRRDVALAVGGYDYGWQPVWFDDLDLCLMMRRAGYKVFFLPDVRVMHRLSMRERELPRQTWWRRAIQAARTFVGEALPDAWRERVVFSLNLDRPQPAHAERLRHHYAYWREKWGWDPLNPDMAAIRERHGGTEICWASDPERRAAGEAIARAFRAPPEPAPTATQVR